MSFRNKKNILIIEDNPADVQLIKEYINDARLKVELWHADALFKAEDILKSHKIDLTILDLGLPDSKGFKTLSKYLKFGHDIPVVVLTGFNNEIIGSQAIKAGAQDFLTKGQIDSKQLSRSIKYSIQRFEVLTKLKKTTETLTISKQKLTDVQHLANFSNWDLDLVSNQMNWSKQVFDILDLSHHTLSPSLSNYIQTVHLEDKEKVKAFFEKASKNTELHQIEHRIRLKNSNIKHILLKARINHNPYTNNIILNGAIQDITIRKENQLKELQNKLRINSSKIHNKTLNTLAFNIKTPLFSITNLMFLLEKNTKNENNEHVYNINQSLLQLSNAVDNLLNYNYLIIDKPNLLPTSIQIMDFINNLKLAFQYFSQKQKINIKTAYHPNTPTTIIIDPKILTQIIHNTLQHIIQNLKENSELTIYTKYYNNANPQLNITISAQKKLFTDPHKNTFTPITTNSIPTLPQQLKLNITKKLTQTLKGTFQIKNINNETHFYINLPCDVHHISQKNINTQPPKQKISILLVEDNFLNQIATKKILSAWSPNIQVTTADNGKIAAQTVLEKNFDIILMDIHMPIMNGIDAIQKIRTYHNTPIIALTAETDTHQQKAALQHGANLYLHKPIQPNELYTKINSLIQQVQFYT